MHCRGGSQEDVSAALTLYADRSEARSSRVRRSAWKCINPSTESARPPHRFHLTALTLPPSQLRTWDKETGPPTGPRRASCTRHRGPSRAPARSPTASLPADALHGRHRSRSGSGGTGTTRSCRASRAECRGRSPPPRSGSHDSDSRIQLPRWLRGLPIGQGMVPVPAHGPDTSEPCRHMEVLSAGTRHSSNWLTQAAPAHPARDGAPLRRTRACGTPRGSRGSSATTARPLPRRP